jgi:hypothetical protein
MALLMVAGTCDGNGASTHYPDPSDGIKLGAWNAECMDAIDVLAQGCIKECYN